MNSPFKENSDVRDIIDRNTFQNISEIDDLPEMHMDMDEEINHLPAFDEEVDEIDLLPDMAETVEEFDVETRRLASLYRTVDELYDIEHIIYSKEKNDLHVYMPHISQLKDIVKNSAPIEVIKTVTYFSFIKLTMAVDYTTSILEHYTGLKVEETYFGEVRDFYNDFVTPEYLKQFYREENVSPEKLAKGLADITCEAVEAVAYLGAKTLLGIAGVVEDAVTFAIGTIADIVEHPEVAEKMYKSDITGRISEVLDDSYNGIQLIKKIGNCAETVGKAGTYIALTILAASEAPIVAIASAAGIGIARAGETTREAVKKTGEYTHKELLCGIISGVVCVASAKLIPTINEGIDKLAVPAIEKIKEKIGDKVTQYIVEMALGTTKAAFIGGVDGAIFEAQDIFNQFVSDALDIDDDFDVNWNKFFKGIASGAAINGSVYLISNIVKDINQHLDEKRAANLKEVSTEKQGGSYKDVKKTSNGETHEVHHMPSDSSSNLDRNDGPAIKMDKADHRRTASCGNSREAREYQQAQKELIEQGKFLEALQMDIDDIHEKFGDKYDSAIAEMMEYVQKLIEEGKING